MTRPWVPGVLIVGALALVASLYLPWQELRCEWTPLRVLQCGLGSNVDGWSTGLGAPTALLAVLVVALAAASFVRPQAFAAPLGQCALTAGYFGIALAVRAPLNARQEGRLLHGHFHLTYGTYLGIAAAGMLLLAACATPFRHHVGLSPGLAATLLAALGLLAALLLPWERFLNGSTEVGLTLAPGTAAAALVTLAPLIYRRAELPLIGVAVLLATGGAFSVLDFPADRAYGAWVGLAVATAFAVITAVLGRPKGSRVPPPRRALPVLLVAPVCLASLFLPWQRNCYPGRCLSANAWTSTAGAATALLVLALVLVALAPSSVVSSLEAAAGIALFVGTLGFSLVDNRTFGAGFGYGAYVGFAAFAALVALVLLCSRPALAAPRLLECWPAMLACAAYVVLVLLPHWQVLSFEADRQLRFGPFSWLTVADVLVALHLLGRWARRLRGARAHDELLIALPLVLLALTSLDLIEQRDRGLTWGGGAAVALCLVLAACGRIEAKGGIRAIQIPELLRVDRI